MTKRERNLPDAFEMLRRGYSNERIAERTRLTTYEVGIMRSTLDLEPLEIAQLSLALKTMTPRSGAEVEQGVGTERTT